MIGLYFLAVVVAYVLVSYWIVRRCKPRWAKWMLVVVAIAVPTWDLVPQHLAYRAACAAEAGEFAASGPIEVAGFFHPEMNEKSARAFVEDLGFKYIETYTIRATGKTLIRVETDRDGAVNAVEIAAPTSRYEIVNFNNLRADRLREAGTRVVERETGRVIASQTSIAKDRSWVFRALFPATWPGGGGAVCSGAAPRYTYLAPGFLVPKPSRINTERIP
jgi:hypothetical protein